MAPRLKHVDPTRPRGRLSRAYAAFSATRLGTDLSARVAWKVDPCLLRVSRGRVGLGFPTALLETRRAKTGAVRRAVGACVTRSGFGTSLGRRV